MASQKRYIVEGNTVREYDPELEREQRRIAREHEIARQKKQHRNAARRNRERAMAMSRGYMVFLVACVMTSALAAATLIRLQASITVHMKSAAALESQLTDLKADNDARYKQITTSADLDHIKDVAINDLGMTYASEDQIVYYTLEKTSYMDQYSSIPQ